MKMNTHTKSFELATALIKCLEVNNWFPVDTARDSLKNLQMVTPETLSQYVIIVKRFSSPWKLEDNTEELFFDPREGTVRTKDNKHIYRVMEFIRLMQDNELMQVQFYPAK